MKGRFVLVSNVLLLISCNRDPNVAKKKYLEMGDRYFQREQYRQAALLYRNAIQRDARYGMAHYSLALTELKWLIGSRARICAGRWKRCRPMPLPSAPTPISSSRQTGTSFLARATSSLWAKWIQWRRTWSRRIRTLSTATGSWQRWLSSMRGRTTARGRRKRKTSLKTAIAEFRKADAAKPRPDTHQDVFGRSAGGGPRFPEAEEMCRELITKDKALSQPYLQLYQIFIAQNRIPDAENVLKLVVTNNPKEMAISPCWLATITFSSAGRRW